MRSASSMMPTMRGKGDRRGGTLALSLLLAVAVLQLRESSSFLIPTTTAAVRGCNAYGSRSASCVWASVEGAAGDSEASAEEPVAAEEEEEEEDDGRAKSPAGLTLEGVYKRLKLETQGLEDGIVGLESKDTDYGVSWTSTVPKVYAQLFFLCSI